MLACIVLRKIPARYIISNLLLDQDEVSLIIRTLLQVKEEILTFTWLGNCALQCCQVVNSSELLTTILRVCGNKLY